MDMGLGVSKNSVFSTQIMHFNRVFPYKPSILGYPYFWKHPYMDLVFCSTILLDSNAAFIMATNSRCSPLGDWAMMAMTSVVFWGP